MLGHDRVLVVCPGCAVDHVVVRATDGTSITMSLSGGDLIDQYPSPFPFACIGASVADVAPEVRRAAIHQAVQHLEPGGMLALHHPVAGRVGAMCCEFGLEAERVPLTDAAGVVLFRRTSRTTVHDLLWRARSSISRVTARHLFDELSLRRPPPIVVDTRTHTDRCRSGVIAGSIHVPRTVLEWHLDAANGYRHPAVTRLDDPLVLVCNGGYSSSLAGASLVDIGFTDVRDLIGGMRAWLLAGLPVAEPDHAHLDV
jgi:rhodanese-related sulfurtransferase